MRLAVPALALLITTLAKGQQAIDSSYANSTYRHTVALFRQLPHDSGAIVFLGNSLTQAGPWQELLNDTKVRNRGISGDVTYGIIARLDEVLMGSPAKLFILTGTNDLKRGIPVDTIAKQFERMLQCIKAASPKTVVYLQSVFPVNEHMKGAPYQRINNRQVLELNTRLKPLAVKYGATYADVHSILTDDTGNLKKEYTHDGIHLWPDAYLHWANFLKQNHYL